MFRQLITSLDLTESHGIVRRYFVVNGFDGALTMLGLIVGFYLSDHVELHVIISACLGAAVALAVSGVSSAYVSEKAEKQKELQELEQAMMENLDESIHGRASRVMPVIVALVNGLSPFLVSLLILSPLWAASHSFVLPLPPLHMAFIIALIVLFAFGVYLGKISGINWLWAGVRVLLIALVTGVIIVMLNRA